MLRSRRHKCATQLLDRCILLKADLRGRKHVFSCKGYHFLVAAIHLGIVWLEMFAWTTVGPKVFTILPEDLFVPTQVLAANQGLYNGFLAAGLLWSLLISDRLWQRNVALCFLIFVLVAGVYGAATASFTILFVQAVPALAGIAVLLLSRSGNVEANVR